MIDRTGSRFGDLLNADSISHVRRRADGVLRALHKLVHQPVVEGLLLSGVAVVLVADERLAAVQPLRVGAVGIVGQQSRG
jgi:hypothetical protein